MTDFLLIGAAVTLYSLILAFSFLSVSPCLFPLPSTISLTKQLAPLLANWDWFLWRSAGKALDEA